MREGFFQKNSKENGRFHSNWLSMMLPRLYIARNLLRDDGVLFVSIDDNEVHNLRCLLNEIFGEENFIGAMIWKSRHNVDIEFILVYSKTDDFIYNQVFRSLSPEEQSSYTMRDERGLYRASTLTTPFDRPARQFPWRGYQPPPGRSWNFPLDKLEALALGNLIHFPSARGFPGLKRYLDDHPGFEIGTTWEDISSVVPSHERTGYTIQTPLALMERIVLLASNSGDQLLDPFCGSGTTLVAAQTMGRHWWGTDSSVESHQITVDRLSKTCGLEAKKDYAVLTDSEVMELPVVDASYRDVIVSTTEIAKLQRVTSALTDHILSLKKQMNIGEDDQEGVEKTIENMERWIVTSLAKQSKSVDSYIGVVCSWLTGWERLDKASQSFLPKAELLFENIGRASGQDYLVFKIINAPPQWFGSLAVYQWRSLKNRFQD